MARTLGKTASRAAARAVKAVSKAAVVTAAGKAVTAVAKKVARPRRTSNLKKAGKLAAVAAVVVGSAYVGRKLYKKKSGK